MFACGTGSMRGLRANTPLLLLLLLLLTSLTGTVLCQDDGEATDTETKEDETVVENEEVNLDTAGDTGEPEILPTDVPGATPTPDPSPTGTDIEKTIEEDQGSGLSRSLPIDDSPDLSEPTVDPSSTDQTEEPGAETEEEEGLNPIIIIIPVALAVVIIAMIVCGIFISRRWKKKEMNQELGKEDPYLDGSSTEKVPMPMFEEDVPSVLELEMEELDQWMKMDGEPAEDSKHA